MPYKAHPSFENVGADDTRLWRYVDFTKFVSMLETGSLFFSILRSLTEIDPFEGRETILDTQRYVAFQQLRWDMFSEDEWRRRGYKSEADLKSIQRARGISADASRQFNLDTVFVNCWRAGKHESDGMWKIYASMRTGIAIVSSFGRLKKSLAAFEPPVFIGKINYADFRASRIESDNALNFVMHKKLEYEHEREVRAVTMDSSDLEGVFLDAAGREVPNTSAWSSARWRRKESAPNGISIPIKVDDLVELIYVSPLAEDWFLDLVRAVAKRYELNVEVRRSDLHAVPT